jgi:hypothetical protein
MKKLFLSILVLISIAAHSQAWKQYYDKKKGMLYADSLYVTARQTSLDTVKKILVVGANNEVFKSYWQTIPTNNNQLTNGSGYITPSSTETLTNKTLNLSSNTVSMTTAQLNTALSDNDVATLAGTETLTNKRITKRSSSITSNSATPSINTDSYDYVSITSQTANITSVTVSGTPTAGQTLWIAITASSGTPTITWGSSFEASASISLPTTISTTRTDFGFVWNEATSKWRIVAIQ